MIDWVIVVVVLLLALGIFIRRRYGSLGELLTQKLGEKWVNLIKVGSLLTVAFWILLWIFIDDARRAELKSYYEANAPWLVDVFDKQ